MAASTPEWLMPLASSCSRTIRRRKRLGSTCWSRAPCALGKAWSYGYLPLCILRKKKQILAVKSMRGHADGQGRFMHGQENIKTFP